MLNFQWTHFADDSKPEEWFVDASTALNYSPNTDDCLGYYPDGVKRTLTDANIQFFRSLEERRAQQAAERIVDGVADGEKPIAQQNRRAKHDVPYNERNKRNWEQYIDDKDAVQGSLTHRRMARELDNKKEDAIFMDY